MQEVQGQMTERQIELIKKCKEAGWGWAKFAESVEKQGFVTQKQEDTLCSMYNRISIAEHRKKNPPKRYGIRRYWLDDPGIGMCDIEGFDGI